MNSKKIGSSAPDTTDARGWTKILARYRTPSLARGIIELSDHSRAACPALVADVGNARCWLLALPDCSRYQAAGFLVRLFMIQHDCGHGAFFQRRSTNDWVGRVIGVLTLTPYDYWRRKHAIHHSTSGNLERRGIGDIDTLTVHEYLARSRWGRLRYRIYRHPFVMFGIGPAYLFILDHRLPVGLMRKGWMPWLSTMATNAAIAALVVMMMWLVGVSPIRARASSNHAVRGFDRRLAVLCAAPIRTYRVGSRRRLESSKRSRFHGSSHYALPGLLRWFTANIGVHHIHHLYSRIPCYRLPLVLRDHPDLDGVGRLTLLQSFRCVRLVLWDEDRQRLVSFRDVSRHHTSIRT